MERYSGQKQAAAQPAKAAARAVAQTKKTTGVDSEAPTLASKILVISLIFVSIAITGTILSGVVKSFTNNDLVKNDKYQAVFLDNGQVYFGKLSGARGDYVRLSDIYYLQVQQQIQPDQQSEGQQQQQQQQQISLAQLGNELHGPENEMFINKSKIVFWENLKTDGDVTEAISRYSSGEQPATQETTQQQQTTTEVTPAESTEVIQ